MRFIWDYDNLTHIARHGISPEEVEYVLSRETVELEYQDWHIEERFTEVGVTGSGRFLTIVTVWVEEGVRVVTAFDSPHDTIRAYLERR